METKEGTKGWILEMQARVWSRLEMRRGGYLEGNEKGQDSFIIRWINDNMKRC
jgi:hypothetical protein